MTILLQEKRKILKQNIAQAELKAMTHQSGFVTCDRQGGRSQQPEQPRCQEEGGDESPTEKWTKAIYKKHNW